MINKMNRIPIIIAIAIVLEACHYASIPTGNGTARDVTFLWPAGDTQMNGPEVAMSHDKRGLYQMNTALAGPAIGALSSLGAAYLQTQMTSLAPSPVPPASPQSRPARVPSVVPTPDPSRASSVVERRATAPEAQPVRIPEFEMLPLP